MQESWPTDLVLVDYCLFSFQGKNLEEIILAQPEKSDE